MRNHTSFFFIINIKHFKALFNTLWVFVHKQYKDLLKSFLWGYCKVLWYDIILIKMIGVWGNIKHKNVLFPHHKSTAFFRIYQIFLVKFLIKKKLFFSLKYLHIWELFCTFATQTNNESINLTYKDYEKNDQRSEKQYLCNYLSSRYQWRT